MELTGPFCQSCGMPMGKTEDFGKNADGSPCDDYFHFCFHNGAFTEPNISMEQMTDKVAGFLVTKMNMSEAQAKGMAKGNIPNLKRWQR